MQIQFISIRYHLKSDPNLSEEEQRRQAGLLAACDCAALARFIEQATALVDQGGEAIEGVHAGALLGGFNVVGRLLASLADQAIDAIEQLKPGPASHGATLARELEGKQPKEGRDMKASGLCNGEIVYVPREAAA